MSNENNNIISPIDFGIFDGTEVYHDHIKCKSSISECKCIQRIIAGLLYYKILNESSKSNDDDNGQTIFHDFLSEQYRYYLDDIIHVKADHDDQLEEIHDLILNNKNYKRCIIEECGSTTRHCQIQDKINEDINSQKNVFWDGLHCFLVHPFELGFRIRKVNLDNDDKDNHGTVEKHDSPSDKCQITDYSLSKQRKQNKLCRCYDRYNNGTNKFTIQSIQSQTNTINSNVEESKISTPSNTETTLDNIYSYLDKTKGILKQEKKEFYEYIQSENYDTDSVFYDTEKVRSSNILSKNQSILFVDTLSEYIHLLNGMNIIISEHEFVVIHILFSISYTVRQRVKPFSCGYSFFYWQEYKDDNKIYGSHKGSELFICSGKYGNLKEEILSNDDNEISDTKIWDKNVMLKAKEFISTKKVKSMKSFDGYYQKIFGIEKDSTMSLEHLQSIILYTDFSCLSSSFTNTFRKNCKMEQLESIKKRNANYYHFSKLLIETIQGFGYDEVDETLYCGMNICLTMENTNIHLRGPTSTSAHLIIAQNFTGDGNGVILQLTGKYERRFNVSWISRYPEEAERTFITGYLPMQLVSIRVQLGNCWVCYQPFIKILFQIDRACHGYYDMEGQTSSTSKDSDILSAIINRKESIPKYIMDCFDLFRMNTNKIEISLHRFDHYPAHIVNLIIDKYIKKKYDSGEIDLNVSNKIKPLFIKLFTNLNNVTIYCGEHPANYYYPFSVIDLVTCLMEMETTDPIELRLEAWWNERNNRRSWLFYLFIKLCGSNSLVKNKVETKQTVNQYFNKYRYNGYDDNKYCSVLIVKEKEIKLELSKDIASRWDNLCIVY